MDPANRIGASSPPATSIAMPADAAPAAAPGGFNPVTLLLPMVTGKFSEWKDERLKSFRPVGTFLSREKLSFPPPTEVMTRVRTNLVYFQTNYFALFALLGLFCVLTSPSLIFWLALIAGAWIYTLKIRTTPFAVSGREIPHKVIVGVLTALTVLIFWMASIGNTIFWLLGATVAVVGLHAIFYTPVEIDEFGFGEVLPTTMPAAAAAPPANAPAAIGAAPLSA